MQRRQGHRERRVDGASTKDRTSERSRRDHPTSRSTATEEKINKQSSASDDVFKTKLLRDHPTSRPTVTEGRTKKQSSASGDVSEQNYFENTSQQSAIKVSLDQQNQLEASESSLVTHP